MNSVNELFKDIFEIAALVVSLAVLAVILQSPNTSNVIGSATGGFSNVLGTAMGKGGGGGGNLFGGLGGGSFG
jgi:PRD1 phage membrane DNA delivery